MSGRCQPVCTSLANLRKQILQRKIRRLLTLPVSTCRITVYVFIAVIEKFSKAANWKERCHPSVPPKLTIEVNLPRNIYNNNNNNNNLFIQRISSYSNSALQECSKIITFILDECYRYSRAIRPIIVYANTAINNRQIM